MRVFLAGGTGHARSPLKEPGAEPGYQASSFRDKPDAHTYANINTKMHYKGAGGILATAWCGCCLQVAVLLKWVEVGGG